MNYKLVWTPFLIFVKVLSDLKVGGVNCRNTKTCSCTVFLTYSGSVINQVIS